MEPILKYRDATLEEISKVSDDLEAIHPSTIRKLFGRMRIAPQTDSRTSLDQNMTKRLALLLNELATIDGAAALIGAKEPVTAANLFLIHLIGTSSALDFIKEDNVSKPVKDVLSQAQIENNQWILGGDSTVGSVLKFATQKFDFTQDGPFFEYIQGSVLDQSRLASMYEFNHGSALDHLKLVSIFEFEYEADSTKIEERRRQIIAEMASLAKAAIVVAPFTYRKFFDHPDIGPVLCTSGLNRMGEPESPLKARKLELLEQNRLEKAALEHWQKKVERDSKPFVEEDWETQWRPTPADWMKLALALAVKYREPGFVIADVPDLSSPDKHIVPDHQFEYMAGMYELTPLSENALEAGGTLAEVLKDKKDSKLWKPARQGKMGGIVTKDSLETTFSGNKKAWGRADADGKTIWSQRSATNLHAMETWDSVVQVAESITIH